jgi:hypothetical protein
MTAPPVRHTLPTVTGCNQHVNSRWVFVLMGDIAIESLNLFGVNCRHRGRMEPFTLVRGQSRMLPVSVGRCRCCVFLLYSYGPPAGRD